MTARLAALARQHDRGRHLARSSSTSSPSKCSAFRTDPDGARARTEEQEILARTGARVRGEPLAAPPRTRAARRRRREGFSRELWPRWRELGWLGIVVPETVRRRRPRLDRPRDRAWRRRTRLLPEPLVGTRPARDDRAAARRQRGAEARRISRRWSSGERLARAGLPGGGEPLRSRAHRRRAPSGPAAAGSSRARRSSVLDGHVADGSSCRRARAGDARDADRRDALPRRGATRPGVGDRATVARRPAPGARSCDSTASRAGADAVLGIEGRGARRCSAACSTARRSGSRPTCSAA